ncbi:MAG: hypothetical protein J0I43_07255 [Microbacterium sp.]|uniref:hypothetical protein n=1 Tax=Microbacterium sp. TaxID=51671 RepID=UPI001AC4F3C7|nr:hypothetical protein [Microbacterium sp.]MBN9177150.1 hypothetical protein [Microbacterium sp.]
MYELAGDILAEGIDELAIAIENAWTMADMPLLSLDRRHWIELFQRVGFLSDSLRSEALKPRMPLILYRAATAHDRRTPGLAWSPNIEQARIFQEYYRRYTPHPLFLFEATVEPHQVLAYFHQTRGEDEYIVNIGNRSIRQLPG